MIEQTGDTGSRGRVRGSAGQVFIARQPILDHAGQVFGYELLHRDSAHDTACLLPAPFVSARVFTDAVLTIGLETLTGGRPAFVNFTRELLVSDAATLLPRESTVIEVLEDVRIDAEVVQACQRLHAQGFSIALDDFAGGTEADTLLPYAKFVKVDVLVTSPQERAELARRLLPSGIRLIAEKVETAETAAETYAAGYRLFQGFHFCRPTISSSPALCPRRLAQVRLLAALARPELTITQLEEIVKGDVALTYRVLRCVGSAAFALPREIGSIREALILLGTEHVRKWALVWSLAGVTGGGAPETITVALMRARCCELLGTTLFGAGGADFFLLGLCSLLDAMLNQSMEAALAKVPLSEFVSSALLGERNRARSLLDAVIAYEGGAWEESTSILRELGLEESRLAEIYTDALTWTRTLRALS